MCVSMYYVLSHVWLFMTPWTIVCQDPLSMEFSRQTCWSGLPFPSPMHGSEKWKLLSLVWLFVDPTGPWNSPGQNLRVGGRSLLQGIFPTQGSNPCLPHCKWILYQLSHEGTEMSAICTVVWTFFGISFLWDWNGIFQSCGPRILWAKGDSLPKGNKVWLHHILLHYSEWPHNLKFMKCVFLQFAI